MSERADLRHSRSHKAAVNKLHQRCTCSYKVCFEFQGRESEVAYFPSGTTWTHPCLPEVLQQTSSEDAGEILYDSGSDRLESPSPVIQVESPPLKRRKYNPRRKEHEFTFLGMKASCQRSLSEFSSLTNYVL